MTTEDRTMSDPDKVQQDYEHFLAYSGLTDAPTIRYAYFHGADVGLDKPEPDWKPIETAPRDATVLVAVESTADNTTYGAGGWRNTQPAYIDDDGAICDPTDWRPGLVRGPYRATHWMALPEPPNGSTP